MRVSQICTELETKQKKENNNYPLFRIQFKFQSPKTFVDSSKPHHLSSWLSRVQPTPVPRLPCTSKRPSPQHASLFPAPAPGLFRASALTEHSAPAFHFAVCLSSFWLLPVILLQVLAWIFSSGAPSQSCPNDQPLSGEEVL